VTAAYLARSESTLIEVSRLGDAERPRITQWLDEQGRGPMEYAVAKATDNPSARKLVPAVAPDTHHWIGAVPMRVQHREPQRCFQRPPFFEDALALVESARREECLEVQGRAVRKGQPNRVLAYSDQEGKVFDDRTRAGVA
jgi:hypothetical protein